MQRCQQSSLRGRMFCNAALLEQAQEYLRIRREKRHADAALTAAWGEFFLVVDARLHQLVNATQMPRDRRDDVVQRAWTAIVKKLHRMRSAEHFHRWMSKVVRVEAARIFRYLSKHPTKSLNAVDMDPEDRHGKASAEREKRSGWVSCFGLGWGNCGRKTRSMPS